MDTLLKKLMDKTLLRVSKREVQPIFYDILQALEGGYILVEVSGDDGGTWLYLARDDGLYEAPLSEMATPAFKRRHFFISMPDSVLYDVLLKDITPAQAVAYSSWGGTEETHPSWTYLRSSKFFQLIQAAVSLP